MKTLALVLLTACVAPTSTTPSRIDVPWDTYPFASEVATKGKDTVKGKVTVDLDLRITHPLTLADRVEFVVRFAGDEIARYPIVGTLETTKGGMIETVPTHVKQRTELPVGDYELDVAYQGHLFEGTRFEIVDLPAWAGERGITLVAHHGSIVNVSEHRMYVAQWWSNDAPAQPWIVEWRRDGKLVTTTSGRERGWNRASTLSIVQGARGRTGAVPMWQLGAEYALPDEVEHAPGTWEARVVHAGSTPVALAFTVLPGGRLGDRHDASSSAYKPDIETRPLPMRRLETAEVAELDAKLAGVAGAELIDLREYPNQLVPPIAMTQPAIRALFRSRELAKLWGEFLELNQKYGGAGTVLMQFSNEEDYNLSPEQKWQRTHAAQVQAGRDAEREGPIRDAANRSRLRVIRGQIEQLIKKLGGPWKPDEIPHV